MNCAGPRLPVYWGNRNWHPHLKDTLRDTERDGIRRALGFVTSAFDSYSGAGQYQEDIDRARAELGPTAPVVDRIPPFHDHPRFIHANAGHLRAGLARGRRGTPWGLRFIRTPTASNHAGFVEMVRELVLERTCGSPRDS